MVINEKELLINARRCGKRFLELCGWFQPDIEDGKLMPKFKFGPTLVGVILLWVVFAVGLALLCLTKVLLVRFGFHVSFERVFASAANIFAGWAWPCGIMIAIYLFKDNLETFAGLIGKACHGNQGAIQPANGAKKEGDESAEDGKALNNDSRESQNRKYRAFEDYALTRLQQEEGVLVQRHVRVFDSMYAFDGAFEKGNLMYIVEVKMQVDKEPLRRFLLHVDRIYNGLSKSQRKCFRTLVCISMNDGEKGMANALRKLSALREEVSVPVEFRFYPFDYREQQEIKA